MVVYLLHQRLRYEYPTPIRHLAHRLVVIPPERHGDQRRVLHRVDVTGAAAEVTSRLDTFGNQVLDVRAAQVPSAIEFEAWAVVETLSGAVAAGVGLERLRDSRLLSPSALTQPDDALQDAAASLRRDGAGSSPLELAWEVNGWVHRALRYRADVTGVRTTAAAALALGQGVCQDYAQVMLALCRLLGIPARYVSGHLVGEGGTHAWVEVLVAGGAGAATVLALDPTHDREAGANYLTIAIGRDYSDVAPTSGTFVARCRGRLSAAKHLSVTDLGLARAS
jgi:transglutaminase-like putative cysteine protease